MRKILTPSLILLLALFFGISNFAATVFAATGSQFTVGLTVLSDVTPPSVPLSLAATAISAGQIDLSWSASTDNVAVSGYVVYRNGTPVATTSSITYSDTGLTASTLYTYTINAFDTSNNYSGLSASASATTLAGGGGGGPPPDTIPPTVSTFSPLNGATGVATTTALQMTMSELVNKGTGNITIRKYLDSSIVEAIPVGSAQVGMVGTVITITPTSPFLSNTQYYIEVAAGAFTDQSGNPFAGISGNATWVFSTGNTTPVIISSVIVTTTATSATVAFDTSVSALAATSWGLTTAYSDGTAGELGYSLAHSVTISGLLPSTLYYFKIVAQDASNNQATPYTGTFTTPSLPPPPDTTPPANPSAFAAVPSYTSVALSWSNPSVPDFQAVRVMRKTSGYPSTPTDGIMVYDGAAQSASDTGLTPGVTYHYTVFARDTSLNYSSGSIVSATTLVTPPTTPPPPGGTTEPPPVTPGGTSPTPPSGGETTPTPGATGTATTTEIFPPITSTSSGPFVDFPTTGTPSAGFLALKLSDFIFTQPGSPSLVSRAGVIRTDGAQNITVSISYDKLPDVLKTMSITVLDPNNNKESSYLLSVNKGKTLFEGVIPAFNKEGQYSFHIDILDHEKQGLVKILGIFDSRIAAKISTGAAAQVSQFVTDTLDSIETPVNAVSPVALPVGVAVGASQAVLLATNVTSVYDLYLLFLKLIGLLTGLFRKKRSEPWGVVYDSVTKRPLDPAYVIAKIKESTKSKGEAITDLDGRYGFLLSPGEYIIEANKTHYKFPSEKLKGRNRDEFYENLYFGDSFRVREGGVVHYNIPLDPLEFDWNEFAKTQDGVFRIYSKNQNIRLWIFNIIFYVGLIFSVLSFAITPTAMNAFVVGIYVCIAAFQIFWKATHTVTRIVSKTTGKPIPFALVRVWLSGVNTVVKKTVADEFGRFYFLVSPGTYFVTIDQKQPDGSYLEVFRTKDMNLKRGVVKEDFIV